MNIGDKVSLNENYCSDLTTNIGNTTGEIVAISSINNIDTYSVIFDGYGEVVLYGYCFIDENGSQCCEYVDTKGLYKNKSLISKIFG